ncbi:hypothetical protein [Nonomuraea rosea]
MALLFVLPGIVNYLPRSGAVRVLTASRENAGRQASGPVGR